MVIAVSRARGPDTLLFLRDLHLLYPFAISEEEIGCSRLLIPYLVLLSREVLFLFFNFLLILL
jgi:hypothetical protein